MKRAFSDKCRNVIQWPTKQAVTQTTIITYWVRDCHTVSWNTSPGIISTSKNLAKFYFVSFTAPHSTLLSLLLAILIKAFGLVLRTSVSLCRQSQHVQNRCGGGKVGSISNGVSFSFCFTNHLLPALLHFPPLLLNLKVDKCHSLNRISNQVSKHVHNNETRRQSPQPLPLTNEVWSSSVVHRSAEVRL